jgi:hypothetical protein
MHDSDKAPVDAGATGVDLVIRSKRAHAST